MSALDFFPKVLDVRCVGPSLEKITCVTTGEVYFNLIILIWFSQDEIYCGSSLGCIYFKKNHELQLGVRSFQVSMQVFLNGFVI